MYQARENILTRLTCYGTLTYKYESIPAKLAKNAKPKEYI